LRLEATEALRLLERREITPGQALRAMRNQRRWETTPPFWFRIRVRQKKGRGVHIVIPIWFVVITVFVLTPLFVIGETVARRYVPKHVPVRGVGLLPFRLSWRMATNGRLELVRVEEPNTSVLISIG
jgi:hypothetical protein